MSFARGARWWTESRGASKESFVCDGLECGRVVRGERRVGGWELEYLRFLERYGKDREEGSCRC